MKPTVPFSSLKKSLIVRRRGKRFEMRSQGRYLLTSYPDLVPRTLGRKQPMAEKTVLVIDDDDVNRQVLEILLRRENIRAMLAQDGKTGLELACSEPPDLILLDVFMPEEDGFEILAQLKQEPATAKIPVVIFTILEREQSRKKALNMGACDYITKPFDMKEIVIRIREIIGGVRK